MAHLENSAVVTILELFSKSYFGLLYEQACYLSLQTILLYLNTSIPS